MNYSIRTSGGEMKGVVNSKVASQLFANVSGVWGPHITDLKKSTFVVTQDTTWTTGDIRFYLWVGDTISEVAL